MTLGEILGDARRAARTIGPALAAADPDLARAAAGASAAAGEPLHVFARVAVADFARSATEDDWTALMRVAQDGEDPGTGCLAQMVRWRLAREATASGAPPPAHT